MTCEQVGEALRRRAWMQLAEEDRVETLPANPAELPDSDDVALDPSLPGWRRLAREYAGPVAGQFAVHPTHVGFEVEVLCDEDLDGEAERWVASEDWTLHRALADTGEGEGLAVR